MPNVIDLASRRVKPAVSTEILHPKAGVRVPIDDPACIDFLIPEVRGEVSSGAYSSDLIRQVSQAIYPGDRVLVIGAGLGVVSCQIALSGNAERVLAVEADPRLIPFMKRLHAANGVDWVEPVHAVLASDAWGRVPFYARHDIRDSSLLPALPDEEASAFVPCMDLNLILMDERINVIVSAIPGASMPLLTGAALDGVERILIDCGEPIQNCPENAEILAPMARKGFAARSDGDMLLFDRVQTARRHGMDAVPLKVAANGA